ncbi:hypothetical protein EYF80_017094 [Liparis tanakae]|uniref:Secreted protein n=1 Tax=Liparis tanakae TaxID=230148 RepID=A0A4Z2I5B3_9TELE|nr:hypothetical protein EYF80_017094 [Liparis tanakae]
MLVAQSLFLCVIGDTAVQLVWVRGAVGHRNHCINLDESLVRTDCFSSPSRSRQRGVDGLVPAGGVGAVGRSHGQTVEDRAAVGPPG